MSGPNARRREGGGVNCVAQPGVTPERAAEEHGGQRSATGVFPCPELFRTSEHAVKNAFGRLSILKLTFSNRMDGHPDVRFARY